MLRQRVNAGTSGRKEKKNTRKTKNTTLGNKSEGTDERRKTKNISRQIKTIQTKQYMP